MKGADRGPESTPAAQERLRSGKAVAASLLLAGVLLCAAAVALWVLFARSCPSRPAAAVSAREGTLAEGTLPRGPSL